MKKQTKVWLGISFLSIVIASLICLPGGTYRVINSVARPSFWARVASVFLNLYNSKEVFFFELNSFH